MTDLRTSDSKVRIGVDGGASKTALIMTDQDGRVLIQQTGPGCSPSHLGPDGARALLLKLLRKLISGIPGIQHQIDQTRLFMAGSPDFWSAFASDLTGFGRVSAADDSVPVLQLACGAEPGAVIHCGTGSFVAARGTDGMNHFAGGLGWRLGDPGSAHDIGRRATGRALDEWDGWQEKSELVELLARESGRNSRNGFLSFFYGEADPNSFLAGLAPAVVELADRQSQAAAEVLAQSIRPLLETVQGVASSLALPSKGVIGLSGRLFESPTVMEIVNTHLPEAHLNRITDPPIEGVRRILASARPAAP